MCTNNPILSIGLPVYNGENFLKEALDSILTQTFEDFELIISDNASTDKTEEICREYAARDQRIRYYRNEQNMGAARNYNRVLELSRGKYFKWASDDDLCAPEFLERCVEVLEQKPSVILSYPRSVRIDEEGRHIAKLADNLDINSPKPHKRFKRYHYLRREFGNQVSGTGTFIPIYGVIRTKILKMTRLVGSYIASDIVLLDELALLGEFYEVTETLFFSRKHLHGSVIANKAFDKRILWFDSMAKSGKLLFPRWRLFVEHLIAINHTPISWSEKIFCYIEMGRYFLVKWRGLAKELIINLARVLNINSISLFGFKKELPKVW
jgi:glycosyltransferase involved in cell wall biosynthesis